MTAEGAAEAHRQPGDTLLTVGGHGINAASENPTILEFLRARAARSGRLASICSGTFLFAAAVLAASRNTRHCLN